MYIWITLWALWMVGIVVLNVSRVRRSARRGGVRYRRGTAYGSSFGTGELSSTSFHHDSGGSSWGGCDSGSSWGGSSSGSDGGSSSSSC